jgi:hypothetical protein
MESGLKGFSTFDTSHTVKYWHPLNAGLHFIFSDSRTKEIMKKENNN